MAHCVGVSGTGLRFARALTSVCHLSAPWPAPFVSSARSVSVTPLTQSVVSSPRPVSVTLLTQSLLSVPRALFYPTDTVGCHN